MALRWRALETSPYVYDFTPLIDFLDDARVAGISHFTIVLAALPSDLSVGDPAINDRAIAYVKALAAATRSARYTNVDLQIWNEPDAGSFWPGNDPETFHAAFAGVAEAWHLATGRKAVGTAMTMNGASWLQEIIDLGTLPVEHVKAYAVNGYVYAAEPEVYPTRVLPFLQMARRDGVELWNTEQTWQSFRETPGGVVIHHPTLMGQDQGSSYIWRSHLVALKAGIDRFYWFGPDEYFAVATGTDGFGCIPMVDEDTREIIPEGYAFLAMVRALAGARLTDWSNSSGLRSVRLRRGGVSGRIFWRTDGQSGNVDLSSYSSGTDMYGDAITLSSAYNVTNEPICVFD